MACNRSHFVLTESGVARCVDLAELALVWAEHLADPSAQIVAAPPLSQAERARLFELVLFQLAPLAD